MRPILFAPEMVCALLNSEPGTRPPKPIDPAKPIKGVTRRLAGDPEKPPYKKGDVLWVREAWRGPSVFDGHPPRNITEGLPVWYEADDSVAVRRQPLRVKLAKEARLLVHAGRYRHARFMCGWMARLWVEVIEEPAWQPLHVISENWREADLEGCPPTEYPREWFVPGWDRLHPAAPWANNPFVWRTPIMRLESPPA